MGFQAELFEDYREPVQLPLMQIEMSLARAEQIEQDKFGDYPFADMFYNGNPSIWPQTNRR